MIVNIDHIKWNRGRPKNLIAGMIVEDHEGNVMLIGDANENGGCCDQTPIISRNGEIRRWAMLEVRMGNKLCVLGQIHTQDAAKYLKRG